MPIYKHIIWDWNGTLINDRWLAIDILNPLLKKYGQPPITTEFYQRHFDFPVENFYRRAGFNFDMVTFETIGTEWMQEYRRRWQECQLHNGALDVLNAIHDENVQQAIVSASDIYILKKGVSHYNLGHFFSDIRGLDHHYATGKLELARDYIRSLDVDPEHILFIGDTIHDFEVAQAAGVNCLLFTGGHHPDYRLKLCGVPLVGSLREVKNYIFEQVRV